MAKVYSVFLCVLLISVLFFPLTSAGRVLLDKPQKDYESGEQSNGRTKIEVKGSHSSPDHSATGHASPFHATPSNSKRDVVPSAKPISFVTPGANGASDVPSVKGSSYVPSAKGTVYGTREKCDPTIHRGCR